jgi:hypothetical protein
LLVPAPASERIASEAHSEAQGLSLKRALGRQFQQSHLLAAVDAVLVCSDGKPTVAVANDQRTVVDTQALVLDLLHI